MTDLIESRIKAIKEGKLPEGYKRTKAGIMPVDWDGTIQTKKLFKKHTDKKHDGDLEILAATQERGIVPRSQIGIDIQCSDEGVKGYKKVSKGDFVISLRSFQGGIEYSEYTGIISPAYTVLKPIKDISTGFYRNYFKTDTFIKRLNGAVYGIRDGKQIGYEDFGDMYVHCPPLAEQERIAEILIQCDRVIELKEKKLDELKQLKKEFLRKMFPAKGCDTPEIRFPGFTGAWEQRKLIDVCDYVDYRGKTPTKTDSGNFLVTARNIKDGYIDYETSQEYISEDDYEETMHRGKPEIGDVLITTEAPCGNVAQVNKENIALAQRIIKYRGHRNLIANTYLKYYLLSPEFQNILNAKSSGGTVKGIKGSILHQQIIKYPKYEEQVKIGQDLNAINNLITLYQRELEETKKYKKTLARLLLTGIVRVKG